MRLFAMSDSQRIPECEQMSHKRAWLDCSPSGNVVV
jgi:hypothetical protein